MSEYFRFETIVSCRLIGMADDPVPGLKRCHPSRMSGKIAPPYRNLRAIQATAAFSLKPDHFPVRKHERTSR